MISKKVAIKIDDLGQINITSVAGEMVLTTLAAGATMQREQMLEKQAIGIKIAKEASAKATEVGIATLYRDIKDNSAP